MKKTFYFLLSFGFIGCGGFLRTDIRSSDNYVDPLQICILYDNKSIQWSLHSNKTGNLDGFRIYAGLPDQQLSEFMLIHELKGDPLATKVNLKDLSTKLDSCKSNLIFVTAVNTANEQSAASNIICWGAKCSTINIPKVNWSEFQYEKDAFIEEALNDYESQTIIDYLWLE